MTVTGLGDSQEDSTLTEWKFPDNAPQQNSSSNSFDEVTFTLLGPLTVFKDGIDYAPTAPKVLQLLALLLMHPGRAVQVDTIIEELWSETPPQSVRTTMQTYVYHLRKCIEENNLAPNREGLVVTKAPGYALTVNEEQVDVSKFRHLYLRGRDLLQQQQVAEASIAFRSALDLWSGPVLANIDCGPILSAYAVELNEQWRNTQHLRIQAEIDNGQHRELIGELRALTAANPLDEDLHEQLMRVLSLSGRRADAMTAFRELRTALNKELGVEPCEKIQLLHQELLSAGNGR